VKEKLRPRHGRYAGETCQQYLGGRKEGKKEGRILREGRNGIKGKKDIKGRKE
jgi:hypothetical protein